MPTTDTKSRRLCLWTSTQHVDVAVFGANQMRGQVAGYPDVFRDFPHDLQKILGQYLELRHDRPLTIHLPFIIISCPFQRPEHFSALT
jgi:hypothetical protein